MEVLSQPARLRQSTVMIWNFCCQPVVSTVPKPIKRISGTFLPHAGATGKSRREK